MNLHFSQGTTACKMMRSGRLRLTQANEFSCNAQAPGDLHRNLQVLASARALHAAYEFRVRRVLRGECEKRWHAPASLLRWAAAVRCHDYRIACAGAPNGVALDGLRAIVIRGDSFLGNLVESDLVQLGNLCFQTAGLLPSLRCGD